MEIMRAVTLLAFLLFIAVAVGANKMAHSEQTYLNKRVEVTNYAP